MFADAIIEMIRKGTAPWQKPWGPGERVLPTNIKTQRPYAGGNSIHLAAQAQRRGWTDVRWGTYRQMQAQGGQVRRGERGTRIISFRDRRRVAVTDERGRPRRDPQGRRLYRHEPLAVPHIRQYTVFNAQQADGLPAPDRNRAGGGRALWTAHRAADAVLVDSGVPIEHRTGDRAMYDLEGDRIVLPARDQFASPTQYYQTALHELGHSTGHPDRMNRATLIEGVAAGFGSVPYAKEELRAEISAMMTGDQVGVGHDPRRGAAYVEGWIQVLKDDPREIRRAAAAAQKISDHVLAQHRVRETPRPDSASRAPQSSESQERPRQGRCRATPRTPPGEPGPPTPSRGFSLDR